MSRTAHHVDQPDDGWYLEHLVSRVELPSAVLQDLSLAPKDQYYSSARATQVEGLIALVKH